MAAFPAFYGAPWFRDAGEGEPGAALGNAAGNDIVVLQIDDQRAAAGHIDGQPGHGDLHADVHAGRSAAQQCRIAGAGAGQIERHLVAIAVTADNGLRAGIELAGGALAAARAALQAHLLGVAGLLVFRRHILNDQPKAVGVRFGLEIAVHAAAGTAPPVARAVANDEVRPAVVLGPNRTRPVPRQRVRPAVAGDVKADVLLGLYGGVILHGDGHLGAGGVDVKRVVLRRCRGGLRQGQQGESGHGGHGAAEQQRKGGNRLARHFNQMFHLTKSPY